MFAKYQTYDYPYASKLNSFLYNIINENIRTTISGGGRSTSYDLHKREFKEVDSILKWIYQIIPLASDYFCGGNGGLRFDVNTLKVASCWGVSYNKGEGVIRHNHFPYSLSFVYCINEPNNFSPFLLEGEKVSLIPGRAVVFLSHQFHEVISSKVDGRCSLAGNIVYNIK